MKALTKEDQRKISPSQAIEILKEGNKRFVSNLRTNRNLLQQVEETKNSQSPFAVIVSCMDSRTSAELIFDQGLGDIFSIRVAGNVINEDILGSAEYACKIVESKLLVVLGHTHCGAVNGAIQNVEMGHLQSFIKKIQKSIPTIKSEKPDLSDEDFGHELTKENVLNSIREIKDQSSVISELVEQNQLQIIGGIYDVETGKVHFLEA